MIAALLSIWLLHVAALVTPGANVLLVSQLAAGDRMRSAVFASLGVTLVTAMWSIAAVLGVNTFFTLFPSFRIALQVAGAIYLLFVATRLWRAGASPHEQRANSMSSFAAFRLGFLTNVTNPKSALFFGSIFSAALPAEASTLLLVSAVAMVIFNALCWHLLLAFLFSRRLVRSGYASKQLLLNRVAGAAVGALGLNLLLGSVRQFAPKMS